MNHAELVTLARQWLTKRCSVVVTEMATTGEIPDAIGWRGGHSIVIECKTTRAHFFSETDYRRSHAPQMGGLRYYLTPSNLAILRSELPPRWGLLELTGVGIRETVKPEPAEPNYPAEQRLLCSCLRRVFKAGCIEGMNVRCYTINDSQTPTATLSVATCEEISA